MVQVWTSEGVGGHLCFASEGVWSHGLRGPILFLGVPICKPVLPSKDGPKMGWDGMGWDAFL